MKNEFFFFILLLVLLISCAEEEMAQGNDNCDGMNSTYTNDVAAIINNSCAVAACHGGATNLPDYSAYNQVFQDRVKINSRVSLGSMPPQNSGITLTQSQRDLIKCWVADGAPE